MGSAKPQVRYQKVAGDDAGMRLDNYLLRVLKGVPRSHVYRIIRSGEVRVNRGRAKAGTRLDADDELRIPPIKLAPASNPGRPPDGLIAKVEAAILHADTDLLVINKPAGLAVHAGSGLRFGIIEVLRASRPQEYLELVHRLDRDTSGCLLLARNRAALNRLRAGLRADNAEKHYLALLSGCWQGGPRSIDAPLARDRERGGERMVEVDSQGKKAVSEFEPVEGFAEAALVKVRIRTGRTHQIRVHAAHMGHPVAGDGKYGDPAFNKDMKKIGLDRMFLHAVGLSLPAVDLAIQATIDSRLQSVLEQLRNTNHA